MNRSITFPIAVVLLSVAGLTQASSAPSQEELNGLGAAKIATPIAGVYSALQAGNCSDGAVFQVDYPGPNAEGERWYRAIGSQEVDIAYFPVTPPRGAASEAGTYSFVLEPAGTQFGPYAFTRFFTYIDSQSFLIHETDANGCDVRISLVRMGALR